MKSLSKKADYKRSNYKRKKILLVSGGIYPPNIYFSGVGTILSLYQKIASKNDEFEFHLLTSAPKQLKETSLKWAAKEEIENRVKFHFIFFNGFESFSVLNLIFTRVFLLLGSIKLQFKFRFDLINDFSSSPWLFLNSLIFRFLGSKTIHTFCTNSRFNFLSSRLWWWFERATDGVVVTSEWVERKLVRNGFPPKKVQYISFGVETEKFVPESKNLPSPTVVFVGSSLQKGRNFFFTAAEEIPQAEFVWVTNKASRPPKKIEEISGMTNIAEVFKQSKIAVFPYTSLEGIFFEPQTILEAMSSGLALVVADFPILKAVIGERNACFFPPDNLAAFIESVKKLVGNHRRQDQLGSQVRKEALKKYKVNMTVDKILGYYHSVLEK